LYQDKALSMNLAKSEKEILGIPFLFFPLWGEIVSIFLGVPRKVILIGFTMVSEVLF
jgi:hypothetical protein